MIGPALAPARVGGHTKSARDAGRRGPFPIGLDAPLVVI